MENIEQLIRLIYDRCLCFQGFNEILLKDVVTAYCLYNEIYVDTDRYDDLINTLWNKLQPAIKDSFDTKEDFDNYIAQDMI